MKHVTLCLIVIAFLVSTACFAAISAQRLANEASQLLPSMARKDSARLTMTLRLADLLFDAAVEVNKSEEFDAKLVERDQLRAISLYEQALTGLNGEVPPPSRENRLRIKFQLARLYTDQGQSKKADSLWWELVQSNDNELQREGALRLAEKLELSSNTRDLNEAARLYDRALLSCNKNSLCSYVKYRRGWVSYRLGDADTGVSYLLQSLKTIDKTSYDELFKDFVLFLAHAKKPAAEAIPLLESLGREYKKDGLVENLSTAYFVADQRNQYYNSLQYLVQNRPRLDQYIEILEFQYSFIRSFGGMSKTFDDFQKALDQKVIGFSSPEKATASERILFRLIVQWDGERQTHPDEYRPLLEKGAVIYVRLYPRSPDLEKVIAGWLAVEPDRDQKLKQLEVWRFTEMRANQPAMETKILDLELILAKEKKDWPLVVEKASALEARTAAKAPERREYVYEKAKALYELKRYDEALPLFLALATPGNSKPDERSLYSENLALDILAQEKRYGEVQAQAASWTQNGDYRKIAEDDTKFARELGDMAGISEKASFTLAVSEVSAAAPTVMAHKSLKVFEDFCLKKKYLPQSCENAKAVAVKLREEDTILLIMRAQGSSPDDLSRELEFAGHFSEAAAPKEKELDHSKSFFTDSLKVALLYELDGRLADRDRVLKSLLQKLTKKNQKLPGPEEDLLLLTLRDAGLVSPAVLNFPWSTGRRLSLSAEFENSGHGTTQTRALLMASCQDLGDAWYRMQLAKERAIDDKERQLSIVGRHSKANFEKRLKALKDLAQNSECLLKGSRIEMKAAVAAAVGRAYVR